MKISKYNVAILLVTAFILSACASKPTDPQQELKDNMQVMRDEVTSNVVDPERRKKILALSRVLETTLLSYKQAQADFASEFAELNRNYDTPRKRLEDVLVSFRSTRKQTMDKVIKLHFDMAALTTEDEWKHIVKHEVKALKVAHELPQGQSGELS